MPSASSNAEATLTASWPTIASTTSRISCGDTSSRIRFQLVHERLVDVQAAGRIQDHKVVAMVLRVHDRAPRDLNRVALPHIEHRDAGFFADHT